MPARGESRPTRVLARVITWVLAHRALASLMLVAMVFGAGLGVLRLEVDFSSKAFYGGSEAGDRLASFQSRWGADDDLLLVLVRDPNEGRSLLEPERLAVLAELSADLEGGPEVLSVRSIVSQSLPMPAVLGSGELGVTDLQTLSQELGPVAWPLLLERLPFVPTLLSADGRATVIVVELGFSSDDVVRTRAAVAQLEATISQHDAALEGQGLTRELAGVPAIRASFFDLVVHDQMIFVPATLLVIGLSLLLIFRSFYGIAIPAIAAGVPTFMLVGLMGWSGEAVGLLNQSYFTLLPVIAVADAIHMVARFDVERRQGPRDRAIVRAGSRVGLACLLTSLTTAAGFASLTGASMPILRSFGLFAALGVLLAFVLVVLVVPLCLSLVDEARPGRALPGLGLVDRLVRASIRRPGVVVGVSVLVLGLALIPAAGVRVDNTLSGLLKADHPTSEASRRVDAELGGVLGLEFELEVGEGEDLRSPGHLAALHGFESWIASEPGVRDVVGLAGVVADTGPLLGGPAVIPDTSEEVGARLEAIAPFAPLEALVLDEGRRLHLHVGMPDGGGEAFVQFADRAEAELRQGMGEGVSVHATGTALLAYRGVNRITTDLRRSLLAVFAIVILVVAISFRSTWPALMVVLPNGAPLVLGYASLGLAGVVLDPLAAVILTLTLGIAVDDTLHVLVRTREELRAGVALELAVTRALEHSGRAVLVTSVVIMGGLALNLGSSFPPLQMLGGLGTVVIGLALIMNLTVLPAIVVLAGGRGLRNSRVAL